MERGAGEILQYYMLSLYSFTCLQLFVYSPINAIINGRRKREKVWQRVEEDGGVIERGKRRRSGKRQNKKVVWKWEPQRLLDSLLAWRQVWLADSPGW